MKQNFDVTYRNIPRTTTSARIAEFTDEARAVWEKTSAYETPVHSLRLPSDPSVLAEVLHHVERYWSTQLRYVIVVGIGGSNLGAQAVYDALRGKEGLADKQPKLLFADTVSAKLLRMIEQLCESEIQYPEQLVINLISKSGGTTESIANFEILYGFFASRFPDIRSRVVVTTDQGSALWLRAEKEGIGRLSIPKEVGGRFSVFSAVGLFPLALVGIDVQALRDGANEILDTCFSGENHALRLAEAVGSAHAHGSTIINFFFFNPELESLGKWARQLYAESLGKEKDRSGKTVHAGITPMVSIGSTDLHSMAQLYLGGPRDKMTLFVRVREESPLVVPDGIFTSLVHGISGKSPDQLMHAIYGGVVAAYTTHELPFGEAVLPAVSPYAIGMFFQLQMLTVMYLGELFYVNTFDQPNVEDYKQTTRTILEAGR